MEAQRGVFPLVPGALSGTVLDPSGAVLPGVTVAISNTDQSLERSTTTDATGRFVFRDLPPAQYGVALTLPGFRTVKSVETVVSGQAVARTFTMTIGGLVETINVACGTGAAYHAPVTERLRSLAVVTEQRVHRLAQALTPVVSAQERAPIRVGGNLQAPRKLVDVRPTCPSTPTAGSIIILEATLNTNGQVQDVKALRNALPKEFLQSATDAIRQWKFTPAMLNGQPVAVIMAITVNYQS